jgi:seryl-tRNA synthetase
MLDPKLIRQDIKVLISALEKRGVRLDIDRLQALEEQRKILQTKVQELQNQRNVRSKAVGIAKAKGENADSILNEVKELGDHLKKAEEEYQVVQAELDERLAFIPNIPHESVPVGQSENDNKLIHQWKEPTSFSFKPKDHVDLGAQHGMNFEEAAKLSGARFVVLHGALAKLQRALAQFMMDVHTKEHGYQEVYVPYLVHADALFGTGQLPNLKDDLFSVSGENGFYLIPTAEVSVTNLVRDQIVDIEKLPIKYVCHSPCFRSEAGSYGKDTRGMLRQHQFEKVELVQIAHPDHSYEVHEALTRHAEIILERLELPYRRMALCTADLGFYAAKTYDLEVWLPGQQCYREISSCSNTESFQARRMKARFKDTKTGKTEWVHTLNGSALAVGRTLIAVMENYQDEQGRIHIPNVLKPYMGMDVIG